MISVNSFFSVTLAVMLKMLNKHIWTFLFKSNPFGSCGSEYGLLSRINIPWESVRNGESHALPRPTESEADFHKILRSSVYTVK